MEVRGWATKEQNIIKGLNAHACLQRGNSKHWYKQRTNTTVDKDFKTKTTQTALSGHQMVWIKTYKYICRTLTNNKIPMW